MVREPFEHSATPVSFTLGQPTPTGVSHSPAVPPAQKLPHSQAAPVEATHSTDSTFPPTPAKQHTPTATAKAPTLPLSSQHPTTRPLPPPPPRRPVPPKATSPISSPSPELPSVPPPIPHPLEDSGERLTPSPTAPAAGSDVVGSNAAGSDSTVLASTVTPATDTTFTTSTARTVHRRSYGWWIVCLTALGLCSGLGTLAFWRLAELPPLPDCQQLSPLAADSERLYCAREAAQSGQAEDLIAGIHLVETWPEDHPLHTDAQALMFDASRALLSMARATINESDLDQAVDLASQIPPQSLLYEEAQTAIARWKDIWQQGEVLYTTAQQALKDRNWDLANEQLVEMGYLDNDYWRREQTDALTQQILRERQGWEYLQQARRLATTNQPEQLAESMALLQKMSPQSYVWEDAQVDFQRWRQTLIGVGMQRWQQGNLQGAIALLRNIAPDPSLDKNVQDLVKFSHAYFLANQTNQRWQPNLQQIWNLSQAIAIADQIPSDSPLYPQVEASLETWQLSLQDLNQLQVASIVADLGNRRSLELAIQQAQAISVDRPRRVQAQTLIAHWQLGIQRLEDQPILDRAYALAASETIPALQAAITQAQEIPLGRALRLDAQTAIAQWRGKIQAIEDQPMLDEATALAEAGRWEDAIRSAQRIQQGRSLYDDAQAAIAQWRGEIQSALIAQDRTILNEANALAAKEWYTAAIDRASQIGANRPLYGEAQASIAQWRSARSAFLNQRSTSAPSASSSSPPSGGGYYSPGYSQ